MPKEKAMMSLPVAITTNNKFQVLVDSYQKPFFGYPVWGKPFDTHTVGYPNKQRYGMNLRGGVRV